MLLVSCKYYTMLLGRVSLIPRLLYEPGNKVRVELALIHILNYTRFTLANIIIVTPYLLPLCPVSSVVSLIVPPCMIVSDRKLGGSYVKLHG